MARETQPSPPIEELADNPVIDEWLGRNLRRATNAVFQNFTEWFTPFQIRPALYGLLSLIENNPGASGARLSELMVVPRANMVLLLRDLETRGLIERMPDPTNRRAHVVTLSEAGLALMPQLHAAHAHHMSDVESLMSPDELQFLLALLQRIWKRTGAIDAAGVDLFD